MFIFPIYFSFKAFNFGPGCISIIIIKIIIMITTHANDFFFPLKLSLSSVTAISHGVSLKSCGGWIESARVARLSSSDEADEIFLKHSHAFPFLLFNSHHLWPPIVFSIILLFCWMADGKNKEICATLELSVARPPSWWDADSGTLARPTADLYIPP